MATSKTQRARTASTKKKSAVNIAPRTTKPARRPRNTSSSSGSYEHMVDVNRMLDRVTS